MSEDKPKGLELGPPIWVESLQTEEEWKESLAKYPSTRHLRRRPTFFRSDYEWRHRMGHSLLPEQIKIINERLDQMKLQVESEKTESEETNLQASIR